MVVSRRHYFVDEAGDGTLFDGKGRVLIGSEGCSRFFMLGLLDVPDPLALGKDLEDLRVRLLSDPYFRKVPSMQPGQHKTELAFHAKDDAPEVRREVFSLLASAPVRFFAVVKDKQSLLQYVRQRNEREPQFRYKPDELYDYLVRRLFTNMVHKDDSYHICFATRGQSDRTAALRTALDAARQRFADKLGITSNAVIQVSACQSALTPCLQATDYFLWALQRLFERGEERYIEYLWPAFHLVQDIDDTRVAAYGVYYTQRKPLTLAALSGRPGI